MANVKLENIKKNYGLLTVIDDLSLEINDGEFCVFVGPSGCGKSTLLRMIAGLEEVSKGQIKISEIDVTNIDPADRGVAMVFQSYALYPHMTVEENMGFGLRMNGERKEKIKEKVLDASKILELDDYLQRKPKALSGGQRQRVAIGRAIVRGPRVFLFDEPLSNLDAELRTNMRLELTRLHAELGTTMIYVTHDQVEAMTLADRIVVLKKGKVEQVGTPIELYENPKNKFVASFIGSPTMNFFNAIYKSNSIEIPILKKTVKRKLDNVLELEKIIIGVRPQNLVISKAKSCFKLEISENLGNISYGYVSPPSGETYIVELQNHEDIPTGSSVEISFKNENLLFFDANTGTRLS
jgi:lactose/L-arabinose transport system ATP-binding protein